MLKLQLLCGNSYTARVVWLSVLFSPPAKATGNPLYFTLRRKTSR